MRQLKTRFLTFLFALIFTTVNLHAADYYLIGGFNNWTLSDPTYKFTEGSNGEYTLDFEGTLTSGFKINDGTWSNNNANWGGSTVLKTDEVYNLELGGTSGNIRLDNNIRNPHIVFNPLQSTLLILGDYNQALYGYGIHGSFIPGWETKKMTEENGIWTVTVDVTAPLVFGIKKFEKSTGYQTDWISSAIGSNAMINTPMPCQLEGTNWRLESAGRFSFNYDPEAMTLTIIRESEDISSHDVYLSGEFNSWNGADDSCKFVEVEDGKYILKMDYLWGEFKIVCDGLWIGTTEPILSGKEYVLMDIDFENMSLATGSGTARDLTFTFDSENNILVVDYKVGNQDYENWYVNVLGGFNSWSDNGIPCNSDGLAIHKDLTIGTSGFKIKVWNGREDIWYSTGGEIPLDTWVKIPGNEDANMTIAGAREGETFDVEFNCATHEIRVTSTFRPQIGDDFECAGLWYTVLDAEARTCETRRGTVRYSPEEDRDIPLSSGNTASGGLILQPQVEYRGETFTVTRIGKCGFAFQPVTFVHLPSTVTTIGDFAFNQAHNLVMDTIPASVTSIGQYAFASCQGLKSVRIEGNPGIIGDWAFGYCTALESVELSETMTNIGFGMFEGCSALRSVALPGSLISILPQAFRGCTGLESVVCPEGLLEVGHHAFMGCKSLRSVVFPAALAALGGNTFEGCEDIADVRYNAEKPVSASANCFSETVYANATLTMPNASLSDIEATEPWSLFRRVVAKDGEKPHEPEFVYTLDYAVPADGSTVGVNELREISTYWHGADWETGINFESEIMLLDGSGTQVASGEIEFDWDNPSKYIVRFAYEATPGDYSVVIPEGILIDANGKPGNPETILHYTVAAPPEPEYFTAMSVSPEDGTVVDYNQGYMLDVINIVYDKADLKLVNPDTVLTIERSDEDGKIVEVLKSESVSLLEWSVNEQLLIVRFNDLRKGGKYSLTVPAGIVAVGNEMNAEQTFTWDYIPDENLYNVRISIDPKPGMYETLPSEFALTIDGPESIKKNILAGNIVTFVTPDGNRMVGANVSVTDNVVTFIPQETMPLNIKGDYTIELKEGALRCTWSDGTTTKTQLTEFVFNVVGHDEPAKPVIGDEFEYEGIWYRVTDAETPAVATRGGSASAPGNRASGDLVIPARVTHGDFEFVVTGVGDYGFYGSEDLLSVSLPAGVERIGEEAFGADPRLTSIIWHPHKRLDSRVTEMIDNPNLLVYVESIDYAPEGMSTNVAVMQTASGEGECESLVLKTGHPFRAALPFTAMRSSLTREFTQKTPLDGCGGWETIVLPFDAANVRVEDRRLTPFSQVTSIQTQYPYWLYEADAAGDWIEAAGIKAGIPYIISMPNNEAYEKRFNISGPVTFSNNARVRITPETTAPYAVTWASGREFRPLWLPLPESEASRAMGLNVGMDDLTDNGEPLAPGSAFYQGIVPEPLQAYVSRIGGERVVRITSEFSGVLLPEAEGSLRVTAAEGVVEILSDSDRHVDLIRVDGVRVASCDLHAGEPYRVVGLEKGVYIVAGRKLVMR